MNPTGRVLVIAKALAKRNVKDWSLPRPSAFSDQEIGAVRVWVRGRGSLLLIADIMPFASCAQKLAHAFGVEFINGSALDAPALLPKPLPRPLLGHSS